MTPLACLIRGINVGGRNLLRMAALRELLEAEGLGSVQTLLQSGNAAFLAPARGRSALAPRLERAIRETAGLDVRVVLRAPDELRRVVVSNPFPEAAGQRPARLLVSFLDGDPDRRAFASLASSWAGPERLHLGSRELFVDYPEGFGTSKLTGALIEKTLGVAATARNWNTVTRLDEMLTALGRQR